MKYRLLIIFTIGLILTGSLFSLSLDLGAARADAHAAKPAAVIPTANFTSDPTVGAAPLQVQFSDESTGNPTGWAWYFGDEAFDNTWTEMVAASPWGARDGHTSVALPDGSIMLMGGNPGFRNDIWRSMDQGATWTEVKAAAEWAGRLDHTSVVLPDGNIVLMGGNDGSSSALLNPRSDVWRSTDQGETWTQMTPFALWTRRDRHTSVALPTGEIVLMGGYNFRIPKRFNDVWLSPDQGVTWTEMISAAPWTGRTSHTSVVLPDGVIVLMGGYDGSQKNDVWRSEDKGATWTQMTDAAPWAARSGHTSVVLPDGSIILMGGYYWDGSANWLNDIWRSTDQGATWEQVTGAAEWSARYRHTSVVLPDGNIVLIGGTGQGTNNVWRWETVGSNEQNPAHTYSELGIYSVALQVYNADGFSSLIREAYIIVTDTMPTPDPTPGPTTTVGPPPDPGAQKIYLPLLVR